MSKVIDLAGQKFGRLTALAPIGPASGGYRWRFLCDCGKEHEASGYHVRRGRIVSCGCYQAEVIRTPGGRRDYEKIPVLDRLMSKVEKQLGPNGCWVWTGAKSALGYGNINTGNNRIGRRTTATHRLAYELLVGPIPDGMEIDHLCRTPSCLRPEHLEPVTPDENKRRAWAVRPRATHCKYGHALNDAYIGRNGRRTCRPCSLARAAAQSAGRAARRCS